MKLEKQEIGVVHPVRIQRSRQHKQVSPNGLPVVYTGRPGKWGNPFDSASLYEEWINGSHLLNYKVGLPPSFEKIKSELRGKNLSCWCKIGDSCHGDLLLEIANS